MINKSIAFIFSIIFLRLISAEVWKTHPAVEIHDLDDVDTLRATFHKWISVHRNQQSQFALHGRQEYSVEKRFAVFRDNAALVNRHNNAYLSGKTSFAMGLDGPFADLTEEEFSTRHLMAPQHCSATHISSGRIPDMKTQFPDAVDWRTKGVITPIKNQGHCGSCWTFSTTGAVEAHHCIANRLTCSGWTGLSEQQLVDCAGGFDNKGCRGGLPSHAFEYIRYVGGIDTEESYTYTAKDEKCKMKHDTIGAKVSDSFNITSFDEEEIVKAVAGVGPVSIAFQVTPDFRLYQHGVFESFNATTGKPNCKTGPQSVNHAVLVVGYGDTEDGTPYYIIRNSWGSLWGMEGYFWMIRGKNMCGISDCASYPIITPGIVDTMYHHRESDDPEIISKTSAPSTSLPKDPIQVI